MITCLLFYLHKCVDVNKNLAGSTLWRMLAPRCYLVQGAGPTCDSSCRSQQGPRHEQECDGYTVSPSNRIGLGRFRAEQVRAVACRLNVNILARKSRDVSVQVEVVGQEPAAFIGAAIKTCPAVAAAVPVVEGDSHSRDLVVLCQC